MTKPALHALIDAADAVVGNHAQAFSVGMFSYQIGSDTWQLYEDLSEAVKAAAKEAQQAVATPSTPGRTPGMVTESIFSTDSFTIPLAEVQHIESRASGYFMVVMKSSTWNNEAGDYNNSICLSKDQIVEFKAAWCRYRHELESLTLAS